VKKLISLSFIFILVFSFCNINIMAYNRLSTRLFRMHIKFHNSPSRIEVSPKFAREFVVLDLDDQRDKFIGETVYREVRVERYSDFWDKPLGDIIITKIHSDLQALACKSRLPASCNSRSSSLRFTIPQLVLTA
jgi:hypothetical protein